MSPSGKPAVLEGREALERFRLLQLKYAMRLELKGLRHSRLGSVIAKVKKAYGFRGNKQRVYDQFCDAAHLER